MFHELHDWCILVILILGIPLTTMLKFNRLSKLTTDIDEIANALQNSELIEISPDKSKIRRNPEVPLPDDTLEYWQEIKRRTVYLVIITIIREMHVTHMEI